MNQEPEKILDGQSEPPGFALWESKLAAATGLTKDEIRAIRKGKLQQGAHWIYVKKRVCYSPEGEAELHRLLKVTRSQKNAATPQSDNAELPAPAIEVLTTLKVFRGGLKNPRILEAHFPEKNPADPANRIAVRVRKNINFTIGMEIPCRVLPGGLYELARPCPRRKGKW